MFEGFVAHNIKPGQIYQRTKLWGGRGTLGQLVFILKVQDVTVFHLSFADGEQNCGPSFFTAHYTRICERCVQMDCLTLGR